MHRRLGLLAATILIAGCAAVPGSSATGSLAAPESAAPTPSGTEPSPPGSSSGVPTLTDGPCPTDVPMSVPTYLAANPDCFGARDVELEGWEDIPDGLGGSGPSFNPAWLGSLYGAASVLASNLFDQSCLSPCEMRFLSVFIDPATSLRFETDGQWVVVTGHRNDPAAETCVYDGKGGPIDLSAEQVRQACRDKFVLTSVRAATPPASALPVCPTASAMRVTVLLSADPACFGGRDVNVLGWLDQGPFCEGMPPGIDPPWLWNCAKLGLWEQLSAAYAGTAFVCMVKACQSIPLVTDPSSPVNFGTSKRWVVLTVHRQDPTAATCHFVYPPDWTGEQESDVYARQTCSATFVATSLQPASAPATP
jgi:hypothetical protein